MRQTEIDDAEWGKPANWHGPFYVSRRDSRAFVPKQTQAMGITVNFGNPTGVGFVVGAAIFLVILVWLMR